ncbi:hypothetical protein FGO68_gene4432 [Halteria grandinella]|uniref:Uncharacterized protein n=1 Tax=Halteria grandinella TaxID=5974 RepID=A0A8J8NCP9_HALGN|nr:hypothetical protein FGO68_gene4432 [Halteria grandinella]
MGKQLIIKDAFDQVSITRKCCLSKYLYSNIALQRTTQEETKTAIPHISQASKKIKKAKTTTAVSRRTVHFQEEEEELVPPLPMSQEKVYTLPFLYPCDSNTQAKLISRYLHGGEGQTSFFTFDDLISSKHVLYLNTERLSFSKLTVIKLIDLQTTLQDYYNAKLKLTQASLSHHASRSRATSQQNPRTSSFLDDMREFLSTYSEPAVESTDEEIELFEDAAGCMLDPDFERLIFRSERLVGMESIEVLSEVQTHHFKFSNVDLRRREDAGELDVEVDAVLPERSGLLRQETTPLPSNRELCGQV